jgi:hypothetical protein
MRVLMFGSNSFRLRHWVIATMFSALILYATASTAQPALKDTLGKVGIGMIPAKKLNVLGEDGLPTGVVSTTKAGFRLQSNPGVVMDFGNQLSTGSGFIQSRDITADNVLYPLLLNPIGGYVGIGTNSPASLLHVSKDGSGSDVEIARFGGANSADRPYVTYGNVASGAYHAGYIMYDQSSDKLSFDRHGGQAITIEMAMSTGGKVGIGITPAAPFHVSKNGSGSDVEIARFGGANSADKPYITYGNVAASGYHAGYIMYDQSSDIFVIDRHGGQAAKIALATNSGSKVGIGTTTPTERLSVDGNVYANGNISANGFITSKKITVTQIGWSDYVFKKEYKLRSLQSLEAFINQNKHLPEVPTAKEVATNGISVGDNQALLLKKIEELTLYVIELKKESQNQQNQINGQKKEIRQLKRQISK